MEDNYNNIFTLQEHTIYINMIILIKIYFDNYVEVKDFSKSDKTGAYDNILYCLITNNHQIPVGEYTLGLGRLNLRILSR